MHMKNLDDFVLLVGGWIFHKSMKPDFNFCKILEIGVKIAKQIQTRRYFWKNRIAKVDKTSKRLVSFPYQIEGGSKGLDSSGWDASGTNLNINGWLDGKKGRCRSPGNWFPTSWQWLEPPRLECEEGSIKAGWVGGGWNWGLG